MPLRNKEGSSSGGVFLGANDLWFVLFCVSMVMHLPSIYSLQTPVDTAVSQAQKVITLEGPVPNEPREERNDAPVVSPTHRLEALGGGAPKGKTVIEMDFLPEGEVLLLLRN